MLMLILIQATWLAPCFNLVTPLAYLSSCNLVELFVPSYVFPNSPRRDR